MKATDEATETRLNWMRDQYVVLFALYSTNNIIIMYHIIILYNDYNNYNNILITPTIYLGTGIYELSSLLLYMIQCMANNVNNFEFLHHISSIMHLIVDY